MSIGAIVSRKKSLPGKSKGTDAGVDFIRVRVSGKFKAWVLRFAQARRSDMSELIDDALAALAKADGFETPPKR